MFNKTCKQVVPTATVHYVEEVSKINPTIISQTQAHPHTMKKNMQSF